MTLADYVACWLKDAPGFFSRPSATGPDAGGLLSMWRPLTFIQHFGTRPERTTTAAAGLEWTLACRHLPSPRLPTAEKLSAFRTVTEHVAQVCVNNESSQNSCPARRKDHTIATEQPYGWPGTTSMFRMFANISCIRSQMRWSIPTTVLLLRISMYLGCCATTASRARSVMRAGLHSSDSCTIRLIGTKDPLSLQTVGTPRVRSAHAAEHAMPR